MQSYLIIRINEGSQGIKGSTGRLLDFLKMQGHEVFLVNQITRNPVKFLLNLFSNNSTRIVFYLFPSRWPKRFNSYLLSASLFLQLKKSNIKYVVSTTVGYTLFVPPRQKFLWAIDNYAAYGMRPNDVRNLLKEFKYSRTLSIGMSLTKYLEAQGFLDVETVGQTHSLIPILENSECVRKNMVYVGDVNKVDLNLLKSLALLGKKYGYEIDVYGPNAPKDFNYVNYLGIVHNEDLPQILKNYKVGLMPYRNLKKFSIGQNPIKLLEYGICGLSILSTWHEEYDFQQKTDNLFIISNPVDENIVLKALNSNLTPKDLDWFSSRYYMNVYQQLCLEY